MYLGGLCFITDPKASRLSFEDMTQAVLTEGVSWIQYRDKERSRREMYEKAAMLRKLTKDFDAIFVVNDYVDIALSVGSDGVHLGQKDLPLKEARRVLGRGKIIGISTHTLEQAIEAEKEGADYIGFGPVFYTATKDVGVPKGTDMLREVRKQVAIPVVAIGGINIDNIKSVLETGIDAVAVASAILSGDVRENARQFMHMIRVSHP